MKDSTRSLIVSAVLLATLSCKTTGRPFGSDLASSQPPLAGERKGKEGSSRVHISSTTNVQKTLAFQTWTTLSSLFATRPDLVGCKDTPGALPTHE